MHGWTPEQVAQAAAARLIADRPRVRAGLQRAVIDSRQVAPGDLFVGLRGARADGGRFAAQALAQGAWGVLTTEEHARAALNAHGPGVIMVVEDPLKSLQSLATAWRRQLNASVIGVTGSTGKTSTKDLLNALISPHRRSVASQANFNTEIGLPLEILAAPEDTEVLILEMGMRGPGQIAELAQIAEPDVGVVVSIGPVHLELLGTIEAIAAAKGELIAGLKPGGTAVIPAEEPLLEPHLRQDIHTITFGDAGDVGLHQAHAGRLQIDAQGERITLQVQFTQAHMRRNLLAAVAAARAIGVAPTGRVDLVLSPGRGQRLALPGGITVIDDCYNANPVSMRAALEDLADTHLRGVTGRRVAILGDMLELGSQERSFHNRLGEHATQTGLELLITVGPLGAAIAEGFDGEAHATADAVQAAALAQELIQPGDTVLVKASRGVGLELVVQALSTEVPA